MHTEDQRITWILEEQAFPRSHAILKEAVLSAGHHFVRIRCASPVLA
jgi:hypothetical protein